MKKMYIRFHILQHMHILYTCFFHFSSVNKVVTQVNVLV